MPEWFSIEVLHGEFTASSWADSHGDALVWAAQEHGVTDWNWHRHSWGVVLEIELADEFVWERFKESPGVLAALDAVPNPVSGLMLYRGRGGSAGARNPRRPRPLSGSGAVSLPPPEPHDDLVAAPAPTLIGQSRLIDG